MSGDPFSKVVEYSYPKGVHLLNKILSPYQRPLVVDDLLEVARQRAGLNDFGDPFFIKSLTQVVNDVNQSTKFHPLGAFLYRNKITMNLINRLWSQYWLQQDTSIQKKLPPAILITGLQRTGTTFLQRLLGAMPEFRGVISWEIVNPVPTSKKKSYYGKYQAWAAHRALNYINPNFKSIHAVDYNSLEEEVVLMEHCFMSSVLEAALTVPNYARWLEGQDQRPAYKDLQMWLQFLLWREPATKHLLLKSPHHMEYLDAFTEVFPNVKIVQTHRTPIKTLASFCSMVEEGVKFFQPKADLHQIGAHWLRKNKRLIDKSQEFKKRKPGYFTDISYKELVTNPIDIVKSIYNDLELEWTSQHLVLVESFLSKHQKNKYGKHSYSLEKYGLSEDIIQSTFKDYLQEYKDYL